MYILQMYFTLLFNHRRQLPYTSNHNLTINLTLTDVDISVFKSIKKNLNTFHKCLAIVSILVVH